MVVVARKCLPGQFPFGPQGLGRWVSGNQGIAPGANQVCPAFLQQGKSHIEPVFRLEKLEQGSLFFAILQRLDDVHFGTVIGSIPV